MTFFRATRTLYGAELSRRQFLRTGGVLMVGISLSGSELVKAEAGKSALPKNTLDPSLATSWIEIHPDNTVLIRTGKSDFGQGTTYTAYRQIVADELSVSFEAITTVVAGNTDSTPDGTGAFDFLGSGMPNIRKAAAYTYQALLDLAALHLGVPKEKITAKDGIFTVGNKKITYGELVKDQQLKLTIPVKGDIFSFDGITVDGNPPMKAVSEYTAIGKSFANPNIRKKVTAKENWISDVRLPGMLHARVIHPKTLGSTLISAGQPDKAKFPNTQLFVKGNLVAVAAPNEWEAIQAAQQVADDTRWSDWKGLPAQETLFKHLRENCDWNSTPLMKGETNKGDAAKTLASASKKLSFTYEMPYMKHAPIGPTIAVADVRADGMVYLHTHNQFPQALRGQMALMLGTTLDKVVVRSYAGPGHYGRSNGGNSGAEDEAVLLSQAFGKPVRVQWMRADDLQWSTQSPPAFADIQIALNENGRITAWQIDHYMPAMQDDRPIGAVLAGLPTMPAPDPKAQDITSTVNSPQDPWVYAQVADLGEFFHGTTQIGQAASPINVGLRDHSMRTPGQYQQNFPREFAINEAAAHANADAIQFRIDHASEERLINVLKQVREASGWETRPSPNPAGKSGSEVLRGRGVSVLFRSASYWACVCHIAVTPSTGNITVEKCTIAVDPGVVINPAQLKRQIEGGTIMGIGHALLEELKFDQSRVMQDDWLSYPILTMADLPEINVVLINNPKVGTYGAGSEAANALAPSAIAAALHDATGKVLRRLPFKPSAVRELLKA
jgi:CO/xanthine dehydrogenase Mo-binding subunit